jgi:hypothetical protein
MLPDWRTYPYPSGRSHIHHQHVLGEIPARRKARKRRPGSKRKEIQLIRKNGRSDLKKTNKGAINHSNPGALKF